MLEREEILQGRKTFFFENIVRYSSFSRARKKFLWHQLRFKAPNRVYLIRLFRLSLSQTILSPILIFVTSEVD